MRGLRSVPARSSIGWVGLGTALVVCLLASSCDSPHAEVAPSIEFTELPPAGEGSPDILHPIAGRVRNAVLGQRIVLFARSGMWWVQPFGDKPYTAIQRDFTWKNSTHPGTAYAALLVDKDYHPPLTINAVPREGGSIHAVALVEGPRLKPAPVKTLNFSGYEWQVRQDPNSPAYSRNLYSADNAWVDERGYLHLQIANGPTGWTSAELHLARSLGYGSYRFVVSDVSNLEPPVAFNIGTWDGSGINQEMNIEISRWGEATGKNAQYVVQPYYVAANVTRFLAPAGRLTFSFDWDPGRVSFRTVRGSGSGGKADLVAEHVFTSGVPSPGNEAVTLHLYEFYNRRVRLRHKAEVIIEKFEYLP
jgi:hypothetical protein